jgi:hypothetical protein
MTARKHLKQLVRARMARTGESYATARRHVVASAGAESTAARFLHFTGSVPAATTLRALLANAGVLAPHTRQPFTEAMVFGLGGGIGAGMFAFRYEKENFSSFYLAGRHLWDDDVAWFERAAKRIGAATHVREAGGARVAERELRDALAAGPAAAWVDAGSLPYRAMPAEWSGGGYHVLTVYEIDDAAGTAIVGDLTDDPIPLPLTDLAAARGRIRKQRNRVLTIGPGAPVDLGTAVRDALAACHHGLLHGRSRNFTLDGFRLWAERLHGDEGRESWTRTFPRGRALWQGLRSIHDFIEHYGTGGGLCRPMFAEFLAEAGAALEQPRLVVLGRRYARIGELWTELASAALPAQVPELAETRRLLTHKAELLHSGGAAATEAVRAAWRDLDALADRVADRFPLDDDAALRLRRDLQQRAHAIHAEEQAAADALAEVTRGG